MNITNQRWLIAPFPECYRNLDKLINVIPHERQGALFFKWALPNRGLGYAEAKLPVGRDQIHQTFESKHGFMG
jgi:hypothetical protein